MKINLAVIETRSLFLITGLYWGDNNMIVKANQNEKCFKGEWADPINEVDSDLEAVMALIMKKNAGGDAGLGGKI